MACVKRERWHHRQGTLVKTALCEPRQNSVFKDGQEGNGASAS